MREKDKDEDGGFGQMFWNMGTRSMKKFFVALNKIENKSLTMTNESEVQDKMNIQCQP